MTFKGPQFRCGLYNTSQLQLSKGAFMIYESSNEGESPNWLRITLAPIEKGTVQMLIATQEFSVYIYPTRRHAEQLAANLMASLKE